ncbi:MAG TPA: glycoside hydrolase family 97 protein [Chitinophagaceae bacterium]|jgi:alpha-glucosidase|nr:glycoside hydrolase family 97 protein [Chitinophagaceae bacterium]
MLRLRKFCFLFFLFAAFTGNAQKDFTISSPDGSLQLRVDAGAQLEWSLTHQSQKILAPSAISLTLKGGEVLGVHPKIQTPLSVGAKFEKIKNKITVVNYKKEIVEDNYNQLTLNCKGDYGLIFRVYNDGAAYRFFTKKNGELTVNAEQAEFNFDKDYNAFIPHTSDLRGGDRYSCSFEEFYANIPLSKFNADTLAYLPLLVELDNNKKAVILEADVQDYPGMFVQLNQQASHGIKATFAPYPLEESLGGFNRINYMVKKRADYIAKVSGTRNFPWRVVVISASDKDLLNNDMVQRLSEPSKINNPSWIKPGKVAWDWWNDWNISHVDFKAGINTATYKYYIDFAAANHIEYVILDEGWSDDWDLNQVKPVIDLDELVQYGKQKNVGLILWSTWYAITRNVDGLCAKYAAKGIKGFKVDFLDRNDQKMIASTYEIASVAAKYQLVLDFHGMFPPQGLMRTWPNVVNFEGVRGMEYSKWSADDRVPTHEVSLPFIRMIAGPMDYTPGAMRNATKGNARPSNSLPVSQGTRCHQVAMYIVYEAPLQMLSDNPTVYMKEQESVNFISSVPTTFDETIALDGKVSEFAAIARRKGDTWYVGAMSNWNARDVMIDFSFLKPGNYEAEIFKDGINADRDATDYKREVIKISPGQKLKVHLSTGGGWAARIYPAP